MPYCRSACGGIDSRVKQFRAGCVLIHAQVRTTRQAPIRARRTPMLKDLRHAIRMLAGAKGWTAVIVVSLAIGIGANTALFSLLNGLLLTKLPVKDPDTLVRFRYVGANDAVTDSSDYGFRNGG